MRALKSNMYFFLIGVLFFTANLFAQQTTAEFISSHMPPKLTTGEQVKDGVQNVYYKDQKLYVIDSWAGLQILDVTDVHQPRELGTIFTEHRPHNVVIDSMYAYLSDEIGGVMVLDVSDPAHIKQVGKIKTEGDAYWVVAKYPYVFVAEETKGLGVYNISNMKFPRKVGGFQTKAWAWSMAMEDNTLYLAEKSGGIYILDVSEPEQPKELGRYLGARFAKSIQVESKIAYVADGPEGLLIIDCSAPSKPRLLGRLKTDGYIYNAYKSGNTVFLANDQKHRIDIVSIIDPAHPVKEGDYQADTKIYATIKHDVYLYVAADENTLILRYNRPPQIVKIENRIVDENAFLEIVPTASDPDQDPLFFSVQNMPEGAQFDSLTGKLSWTPSYEQSGVYKDIKITVTERTASALSASTTFDITVQHVNRNPSLPDVVDAEVNENELLTFTVPEGSDPDKEDQGKLIYSAEDLPEGAVFDGKTRVFSWTPTYEQSGVYPVTFVVTDPMGGRAQDLCTITVHHVDRKPVLAEVGPQQISEDSLLVIKLQGSDPDKEDQDKLSYRAENLPPGAEFEPATATFTWKPTYEQSGEYKGVRFIFTAGKLSDSISVDISVRHVNRPPVLEAIADQTVDENKTLRFTIHGSDPDQEDAGKLTYSAENLPQGAVFKADSALFVWTPSYEQSGVYQGVTFSISDPSGLKDSKSITITVRHVNRPPALAAIEPKTVNENETLTFELQGSDPDREDTGKLTYSAEGLPQGAVLQGAKFSWTPTYEQSGQYEINFTVSDGRLNDSKQTTITVNHVNRPPMLQPVAAQTVDENQTLSFTVQGSDPDKEDAGKTHYTVSNLPQGAAFDSTSGQFTWTPTFEQSGVYQLTFGIMDPSGEKDEKETAITVNHVNRTPELPPQPAQTVDENQPLVFQVVPGSDPDKEDQDKLVYSAENLPPGAEFDAQALTLRWTPTFDQSGQYTVTIKLTDGAFTVSQPLQITVNHVNRPPVVAQPPDQTVDENTPWSLELNINDLDKEDEGKLNVTVTNLPEGAAFDAATNTVQWTPTYDQAGTYSGITITASDPAGLSDSKQFTVTVNNVNRSPVLDAVAPVSGTENAPLTFTLTASDPDKEDENKLVFSCANLPEGASLDAQNGVFAWTPSFLQAGQYVLNFKVTDSGNLSAEQQVTVTIEDVNHPPVLKEIPAQTVKENEQIQFQVEGSDPDTDNQLTYTAQNLPQGATFDPASGLFRWTPNYEQAGDYSVTFVVSDGKESAQVTVPIKVENVNRAPEFTDISSQSVKENETLRFTVQAQDPDEGSTLSFSAENLPDGAQFDPATQTFTWQPDYSQSGKYTARFTVSDGELSASREVTINVENVNRPPEIEGPASKQVEVGQSLEFKYEGKDADNDDLRFEASGLPDGASMSDDGEFRWTPQPGQGGSYTVTVTVSDGTDSASASTTITVTEQPAPADTTGR